MTTTTDLSTDTLSLASMTPRAQRIWLDAYGLGYQHGIVREHERLERVYHAQLVDLGLCFCVPDDQIRAAFRAIANSPDFAELEERRGRPKSAARHRALLEVRGLGVGAA